MTTSTIKAIIIDDEERARNTLSSFIKQFCPDVELIAAVANVPAGVIAINQHRPQLVFLDIEMPEYNGFELLNFFRDVDFEIIFVTAYHEYTLKAFEVSAVDYLLKPVDIDKLKAAVEKAKLKLSKQNMQQRLDLLKDAFHNDQFSKIALPVMDGLLFVEVNDIMYLEADGSYTNVHFKTGSPLLVSKKIKFFEEVLTGRVNFFRSHKSYIVNINFIKKYNRGDSTLILENGSSVHVARERKSDFEQQLKDNKLTVG
ncbi:MAG TPA: LytTR family DNA-binding domain-containing protein [Bacteroidia bacterium]|nr:LytTR family DNA-binding domain-containing protein [Bacteroidia bacterium]